MRVLHRGSSEYGPGRLRCYAAELGVLAVLAALVVTLQFASGVYRSEVGGHADEGAHFITGLMVHDYLVAKDHRSPLRFAENYYVHYPRVALGHWPPLFYVVEAAWLLLFGATVSMAHALVGVLAVLLGFLLYRTVAARHGRAAGLAASALMLATPLVAASTGLIMADLLVALTAWVATLLFARYLQTTQLRDALWFGVFAVLALLAKGSAASLAAVPMAGIVLGRRWRLLAQAPLWLATLLVFAGSAPWYWLTAHMAFPKGDSASFGYATTALHWYWSTLFWFAGPLVGMAAVGGIVSRVLRPLWRGLTVDPLESCMVGLILGTMAVVCAIPAGLEGRYILPAVPAVLFFGTEGVVWAAAVLPWLRQNPKAGAALLTALALVAFLVSSFRLVKRADSGFAFINAEVLAPSVRHKPVVLIGADPTGENMMLSDLVQRERRPAHFVLRAGKVLASQNWSMGDYSLRYHTPAEVISYLDSVPVDYVIIDTSPAEFLRQEHLDLLTRAIQESPERWREVGRFPRVRDGHEWPQAVGVYEFLHPPSPTLHIRIDQGRMLNRELEFISASGWEGRQAATP